MTGFVSEPSVNVIRVSTVVAFLCLVVTSIITHAIGPNNAQVSNEYPTLITPDGWAFSIWGIIWTLQAIWTVYVCVADISQVERFAVARAATVPLLLVWLLQAVWQVFFMHYCFLACLIVIVGATISSWSAVWILDASAEWNWAAHILYASMSMNTAWLCVASSIQALVYIGKDVHHSDFSTPFSNEVYLSILFTLIAVAITLQRVVSTGNPYFPGVCVWALTAIQRKNKDSQLYELRDYVDALHVLAIFVLVYAILECFLKRFVPGVRDTVREALGVERQSTTLADVYDTLHEESTDLNEEEI